MLYSITIVLLIRLVIVWVLLLRVHFVVTSTGLFIGCCLFSLSFFCYTLTLHIALHTHTHHTHTHTNTPHTPLTYPKCRCTILDVLFVFHFSTAFGSFLDASVDVPSVFTKGPSSQYLSLSLSLSLSLTLSLCLARTLSASISSSGGGSSSKRSPVQTCTDSNKFITGCSNGIYFFPRLTFVLSTANVCWVVSSEGKVSVSWDDCDSTSTLLN